MDNNHQTNHDQEQNYTPLINLVRVSRPLALLAGVFLYAIGGGIVHFLGYPIDWKTYLVGQATITVLQLSSYYLKAYYDTPQPEENDSPVENKPGAPESQRHGQLPRMVVLQAALVTMTVGAVLTVLMLASKTIQLPAFIFLGFALLLAFFYSVPPVRLVYSGYGEFTMSILMANLIPALSLMFQTGDVHRILAMLTFPLTAIFMAFKLAMTLRSYGADMRYGRGTMMVRMGWQRGMALHNILLLVGYLLFAVAATLGLPWVLTWPALLSLPVALFEIYQIYQIARGGKPRWNLLWITSISTLGLTLYLINLALWTH